MNYTCNKCHREYDSEKVKKHEVSDPDFVRVARSSKRPLELICNYCMDRKRGHIRKASKKYIPNVRLGM
jgi:hypothetical protein